MKKMVIKISIYFILIWLMLRFPINHRFDLYLLVGIFIFLAYLMFMFNWEWFEKLEVKYGN